ncbi:TPA: hypothetical protein JIU35_12160, partial [Acinetobacter baumannii]|nr:hypothetical protein [Acinetobacter baumannii]
QKIGVRIEKATLYIKEPYANLIELPKTTTKELSQYKTFIFKDAKVLFLAISPENSGLFISTNFSIDDLE